MWGKPAYVAGMLRKHLPRGVRIMVQRVEDSVFFKLCSSSDYKIGADIRNVVEGIKARNARVQGLSLFVYCNSDGETCAHIRTKSDMKNIMRDAVVESVMET